MIFRECLWFFLECQRRPLKADRSLSPNPILTQPLVQNPTHSHLTFDIVNFFFSRISFFLWFRIRNRFSLILFQILLFLFKFSVSVFSRQSIRISRNIWSQSKNCCWIICRVIWRILKKKIDFLKKFSIF